MSIHNIFSYENARTVNIVAITLNVYAVLSNISPYSPVIWLNILACIFLYWSLNSNKRKHKDYILAQEKLANDMQDIEIKYLLVNLVIWIHNNKHLNIQDISVELNSWLDVHDQIAIDNKTRREIISRPVIIK